jgi:hypothetical protein
MSVNYFARLATPIKPIMDNIYLDWFFFFVPNRLVWDHWQNFCFEQEDPDDSTDYVIPTVTAASNSDNNYVGSLWDYFGLPVNTTNNLSGINAFHSALSISSGTNGSEMKIFRNLSRSRKAILMKYWILLALLISLLGFSRPVPILFPA